MWSHGHDTIYNNVIFTMCTSAHIYLQNILLNSECGKKSYPKFGIVTIILVKVRIYFGHVSHLNTLLDNAKKTILFNDQFGVMSLYVNIFFSFYL